MQHTCLICRTKRDHFNFTAREMFFGTRESFEYFECAHCGTLQIVEVPQDLGRHYPENYYSYSATEKRSSDLEVKLRRLRTDHWLGHSEALTGRSLAYLSQRKPEYIYWFQHLGLSTASKILDVGCGAGQFLLTLRRDGFSCLKGLDPFLPGPINHGASLTISSSGIDTEHDQYDLIMFHHSLEHMVSPLAALKHARSLLKPKGHILIRVPVAGCYAWRKYRQNWYSLDAPRHLFVPTPYGMSLLAGEIGLKVKRTFYDSDTGQILASEKYVRDIPLVKQGQSGHTETTPERKLALENFVRTLNHLGDGDCAGFILGTD